MIKTYPCPATRGVLSGDATGGLLAAFSAPGRKRLLVALLATTLFCSGLVNTGSAEIGSWTRLYSGVEYATGSKTSPRLMRAFAMRIDLRNPNVVMDLTAPNGSLPNETTRQTTPAYRDGSGAKVAINAHFFRTNGNYADLVGLAIRNSSTYSDHESIAPWQLRFTSSNVASIVGATGNPSGFRTAVAGNDLVLEDGVPRGDDGTADPRTVAGLSSDGKYLILVVIDGRQEDWSLGATYKDGGQWAKDFGAYNAINLDGGGSSTMVRESGSGSLVLNKPSDGSPRAVGSNMGVKSKDIDDRLDVVVRGASNKVYWKSFWRNSGGWSSWVDLGGSAMEKPGISSRGPGQLEVFTRDSSNNIQFRSMHDYGTWGSWYSLGGPVASGVSAVSRTSSRINLVARGTDDTIQHKWWTPSGWSAFQSLGNSTNATPSISARDSNTMDVFARGSTDNDLQHRYWTASNGWSNWQSLGGTLSSGPSSVSRSSEKINVVARGGGNNIYQKFWTAGAGWSSSWQNLGGSTYYAPGIAAWDADRLDVVITGTDGDIQQRYWTSSNGWSSGWGSLGGTGTAGAEAVGGQW